MALKKQSSVEPEKVALYDKLIASHPDIPRKGATIPYTSVNGHMFTLLGKDGSVGIRLGEEDREEFLKKHKASLLEQYGIVMKEYVKVPDSLLKDTKTLKKYLDKSFAYVNSLKPKPGAKEKKELAKKKSK